MGGAYHGTTNTFEKQMPVKIINHYVFFEQVNKMKMSPPSTKSKSGHPVNKTKITPNPPVNKTKMSPLVN